MAARRSLVYVGFNRWDTIWQRSHHLAQELSRFYRVLYVDPVAYSLPGYIRRFLQTDCSQNLLPKVDSVNNSLTVFSPPPLLPFSLDNERINYFNHAGLAWMLKNVLRRLGMEAPILWITYPTQIVLVDALAGQLICYDCMDNYAAFYAPNSARARLANKLEMELLSRSNLVLATSASLQNRLEVYCSPVHLIRNAVSDHFLTYSGQEQKPLPDWPAGYGPVIGYMGTISAWLDFEAILSLAARHPHWRLVFVGPTEISLSSIEFPPNVFFLGSKTYDVLVAYVARFDVALIPFKVNELTLNVNPVKIYEYFALGKSVVATALPELLPFSEICYLANGTEAFIRQVEIAVAELDSEVHALLVQKRQAVAQQNTWSHRAAEVISLIEAIAKNP